MSSSNSLSLDVYSVQNKLLCNVTLNSAAKISDLKTAIYKHLPHYQQSRQSIRLSLTGKDSKDSLLLTGLGLKDGDRVYVKDLGPQISWRLVFLLEYLGPLQVYVVMLARPWFFYDLDNGKNNFSTTACIAAVCWIFHYAKRVHETLFVHRFSHGTMPIRNLFKNCGYYWGFAAVVAFYVNHPLFTPPPAIQVAVGLIIFMVCEIGNLHVHLLLRDLRPEGTDHRRIPVPNHRVLTKLFNYVSCPNYTYEIGAWIGFSIMTNCFPAMLFTFAGMYQMTVWALGKHSAYKKEFNSYPKERKAIIPFIL